MTSRHWLTATLTPAWLRLGKIAAFSILAALASAVGMAFPEAQNAEAQGIHQGYTYSQRYCQEYGQNPRYYQVRDPLPGSDWRNDGGWAIILVRSQATRTLTGYTLNFGGVRLSGATPPLIEVPAHGAVKTLQIDYRNGRHGYTLYDASGNRSVSSNGAWRVVIDRDQDGDVDAADRLPNPFAPSTLVYEVWYAATATYPEDYGATYTRWANLRWCR